MELTDAEKKSNEIIKQFSEVIQNSKNIYETIEIDNITIIQTKKPAHKQEYRTIEKIISTTYGRLKRAAFVQCKIKDDWKFIPNPTHIKQQESVNVKELPITLKGVNSSVLNTIKKILPTIKSSNNHYQIYLPTSQDIFRKHNTQNYQFTSILSQIFPAHKIIEKKYPNINDYLSPQKD